MNIPVDNGNANIKIHYIWPKDLTKKN